MFDISALANVWHLTLVYNFRVAQHNEPLQEGIK